MGGKSGGGGSSQDPMSIKTTLVDPVTGITYSSTPYGEAYGGQKSASDQLNEAIAARKEKEAAESAAAAAKEAETTATNRANFNTNMTNAYNDALNSITRQFQLQGLDPNTYMASDITPRLTAARNAIQDLDPNPSAGYSADLGQTIINDLTSGVRTRGLNELNSIFTPTYSAVNLPSSSLSPYVDQILSEQFDPLTSQLDIAHKRGTLNDIGYNAASNTLGQKRTGARASIQSLGEDILASDRSDLDDYINNARSAANSATINSGFNPNAYTSGAQDMVTTDLANLGGAVRNAVGDTKYASFNELLNAGGAVQGGANTTSLNAAGEIPKTAGLQAQYDELALQKRGLGNAGAF